jgi:AraC family transcriptional regulator
MYKVYNESVIDFAPVKQRDGVVVYSMLKEFEHNIKASNFSIRYVIEGNEKYTLRDEDYIVRSGEYLLGNQFSDGKIEIGSKDFVKGICIGIMPEMLSEVVASFIKPDTSICDIELDTFFSSTSFLENKYNVASTNLGNFLLELNTVISSNPFHKFAFGKEFYFSLSEKIVQDHIPIFKQLHSIKSIKESTKKDLFRRISKGKLYIDNYFASELDIQTIAREAQISEYHFFRLFKTIYGTSPYQYILAKRLAFSYGLLLSQNNGVSEIADLAGFSDVYSFSKAFKKHYGVSPSFLLNK